MPWTIGTAISMGAPGLCARVTASNIDAAAAERRTLDSSKQWLEPRRSPMCGNSVCQDRRFLARHMPALEQFFHYRNLDVSTLKELALRWAPDVAEGFRKTSTHLALDDVRESIGELQYYRERLSAPALGSLTCTASFAQKHPGLDHRIGIQGQAVDALFDQPTRQFGVIGWALPADPDVFSRALQALIAIAMRNLTASSRSSKDLATTLESRSSPSAS